DNLRTFEDLEVRPRTIRVIAVSHQEDGSPVLDHLLYPVGYLSRPLTSAYCLAIAEGEDPYHLVIPMPDLIRFYYTPSTDLAKARFSGDHLAGKNGLYNQNETRLRDDEILELKLRKGFDNKDAWVIARMAASETAKAGAERVFRSRPAYPLLLARRAANIDK